MTEFNDLQANLQESRRERQTEKKAVFRSREKLNKLQREKGLVLRSSGKDSQPYQTLLAHEAELNEVLSRHQSSLTEITAAELSLLEKFELYTDPRIHVAKHSDQFPVLLFPVRLETRFKKIQIDDGDIQHQLWVRIFPDECSIDSFDDTLSESEVKKAQNYWTNVWKAGKASNPDLDAFVHDKVIGAWRELMGIINAGRAHWIIEHYQPENAADIPERNDPSDRILVIPTQDLPDVAIQDALKDYWQAVFLANSDLDQTMAAFMALVAIAEVSEEEARQLIEEYTPESLALDLDEAIRDALKVYWRDIRLAKGDLDKINAAFTALVAIAEVSEEEARQLIEMYPSHIVEPDLDEVILDALKAYWEAVSLANGDPDQINAAFMALAAIPEVGEEGARQLIEKYLPQNMEPGLDDPLAPPDVKIVFLVFPKSQEVDTKLAAWSQVARVNTFPEKFVLLGYQEGNSDPIIQELGRPVVDPLIVGPDPGADINQILKGVYDEKFDTFSDDEKAEKYIEYLSGMSETKWLFDFDKAINIGMGFKVDISEQEYQQGFEHLFVLGVKLSADKDEGQALLEQLIHNHHFGNSGFSILPQGAATNNTDDSKSGYSVTEDASEAYARYYSDSPPDDSSEVTKKFDGRWLAELLGIDIDNATLNQVAGYYHKDQCEARAMNTALWNATLGYYMESMLTPVFDDWHRFMTRWFLINHVSGRGRVPAVRIGDQPYGILPVTTISNLGWLAQDDSELAQVYSDQMPFLRGIHEILHTLKDAWEELLDLVAYVGKEGDAHKILLKTLGLHAGSVEFDQRYAESFQHIFNKLKAQGVSGEALAAFVVGGYKERGMQLLKDLGYDHNEKLDPKIPILEKFFLTKEINVYKPLIDDRELSEIEKIRAYTNTGQNYIEWLIINAKENHLNIREQKDFLDNKAPYALLYDMLRHSLNLEFGNTGLKYYLNAEILNTAQIAETRVDADFIGIQEQKIQLESKWDLIYRSDNRLTDPGVLLVDHISSLIKSNIVNAQTRQLHEVIEALEQLKSAPTARLERVFVEHLDSCTYRLDAWLLGFVNLQLNFMRFGEEAKGEEAVAKQGIYLGAYGWLENLKPEDKTMTPVNLSPELKEIFDPSGEKAPAIDNSNAGYVHAPSINHGLTAAVLRNAYISNASEDQAEPYKVNLSSERVRMALSIVEGIQQGQNLGALLGYQLERGLHDRTDEELDVYIYELRKVFPLGSNRLLTTQIKTDRIAQTPEEEQRFAEEKEEFEQGKAITKIEARNVVDGLALLEHIKKIDKETYPFDFPIGEGVGKLKFADDNERKAIDEEVNRLMNIRDAVADLAMAESVHQVVQGNYDRAAGALDTYSKGSYPQMPDVVRSPTSGVSLTHRFGIHLPTDAIPDVGDTPRAKAEPAINQWLIDLFPTDLATIACQVEYKIPDYEQSDANPTIQKTVSMADLGLMPVDLLYMLDVESDKSLTALDDHIIKFIHTDDNPRPDVELEIKYTHIIDDKVTFFELATMIDNLRSLVISSRPLMPTDIILQNEASEAPNPTSTIDSNRIQNAKNDVVDLVSLVETDVVDVIDPLIDVENFDVALTNKAVIIAQIDTVAGVFIDHLHNLSLYGIPQSGFGFIYDRKRAIYSAVIQKVVEYLNRWLDKQKKYNDLINVQLPGEPDEGEQIRILQEAERTISTQVTIPLEPIPDYLVILADKKGDFDQKLADMQAIIDTNFFSLAALVDAINKLKIGNGGKPGLDFFDLLTIDIEDEERQILILAEDIHAQAGKLVAVLKDKMDKVQLKINDAGTSSSPKEVGKLLTEVAKSIFGEDFQVVPVFKLSEMHGNELQKCLDDQSQLLDYQTNVLSNDFPVDDWLYGSARVRGKLNAWENLVILAEGFKQQPSLDLTPVQLPYTENDHWLGLEYPKNYEIEGDKLLYTAYIPVFNKAEFQCGLLVDEWTEVIPTKKETTGMTFHYDRPNSEPPQTMLLVTPSAFTGQWQWTDLVGTLKETLDLAKLRAVEPDLIDRTIYAQFLPATVAPVTGLPVTMAVNYALSADQNFNVSSGDDE